MLTLSFVMSCGRSVDKRLVLADTLMWTNPDSSLAILEKIDSKSLKGKENQAYYALLLTQSQFRVDFDIPSDSLINFAVDHYRNSNNREHLTRALLYKGAYYTVATFVNVDLPLVNNLLPFAGNLFLVKGETALIYSSWAVSGLPSNCSY